MQASRRMSGRLRYPHTVIAPRAKRMNVAMPVWRYLMRLTNVSTLQHIRTQQVAIPDRHDTVRLTLVAINSPMEQGALVECWNRRRKEHKN